VGQNQILGRFPYYDEVVNKQKSCHSAFSSFPISPESGAPVSFISCSFKCSGTSFPFFSSTFSMDLSIVVSLILEDSAPRLRLSFLIGGPMLN
jgi:hypothetical protein